MTWRRSPTSCPATVRSDRTGQVPVAAAPLRCSPRSPLATAERVAPEYDIGVYANAAVERVLNEVTLSQIPASRSPVVEPHFERCPTSNRDRPNPEPRPHVGCSD